MRPPSQQALHYFAYWNWPAPFTTEIEGRNIRVSPVRVKCRAGAARRKMLAHVVSKAASVTADGQVTYAAKWGCRETNGSLDVIFLADPRDAGAMCKLCFEDIAGFDIGVYRIYDSAGALLYIGSSESISARIPDHRRTAPWRTRIADVKFTEYPTLAAARAAEIRAIGMERPEFNTADRAGTRILADT